MISSVKELGKERRHFLFTRSHHPRANLQDMKCKSCDKECLQNCSILGMTVWTLGSSPKWTCHNNSSYFPTEQMWDGRSWLCCHFPSFRACRQLGAERRKGREETRHFHLTSFSRWQMCGKGTAEWELRGKGRKVPATFAHTRHFACPGTKMSFRSEWKWSTIKNTKTFSSCRILNFLSAKS